MLKSRRVFRAVSTADAARHQTDRIHDESMMASPVRLIPPAPSASRPDHTSAQSVFDFVREGNQWSLATTPIIYSLSIPFLLLDLWVTAFQWICFPIYGMARVPRRRYFVFDRHRLPYLNWLERAHCVYCSYANGVIAYTREVAARTEQYWCPIQHARPPRGAHHRLASFFPYGDGGAYRRGLAIMRRRLRARRSPTRL